MKIVKRVLWLTTITVGLWNVPAQAKPQQDLEFEPDTIGVLDEINTLLIEEISETPAVPGELLRERFAKLEREIPLVYHKVSHQFVEYFIYKKPDFTRRMMEHSPLYLPLFEQYLKKYNLPTELKYLSMIESGLNPRIISYASAGGLWQFMPATGREFGLYQDKFIDERFDPVKSTEAACKYLRQLYRIFGDWEMALASYNTGPGNVKRAMRRSGGNTFWTIYSALPQQTRSYVPQYVAMTYMMHYGSDHGIVAVNPEFPTVTDTLHINGYFDLTRFAQFSEVSLEDIVKLNPQIVGTEIPGHIRNFVLKVPAEKFAYFSSNRAAILDSCRRPLQLSAGTLLASNTGEAGTVTYQKRKMTHIVRRGENLTSIANKYDVDVQDVKEWNRLRKSTLLKGQKLVVYREVAVKTPVATTLAVATTTAPATTLTAAPVKEEALAANQEAQDEASEEESPVKTIVTHQKRKLTHVVKRGENLTSIANRYKVEVQDLKEWNRLRKSSIQSGQKLAIFREVAVKTPVKQATLVASATTKPAPATTPEKEEEALASTTEVEDNDEEAPVTVAKKAVAPQKRKTTHVVKSGDNLIAIAKRYGVEVSEVKAWNHLSKNSIQRGQKLVVYQEGTSGTLTASVREKELAQPKSQKSIKLRYHTVQNGDTLWNISQQYGMSIDKLKKENNIRGNTLKPGQKLLITG
ncbi:LysM peptidoglycan-binding domain-containing protein [Telluribacter sp.]|jgi:membrane-bound lytic murein transglycosylase D|uniref:LysM peptidoglycan-binding domain-containing protein n=1 Tax=Telluribacter sp. TaxID=1978767 RepID=UPI002E1635A6|nr:LysM peptidoglycan-binding domain-containing protein [Telluribacter sp.]